MRTAIVTLALAALAAGPVVLAEPAGPVAASPAGGSDVSGKVLYKGSKLKRNKVPGLEADPYCSSTHGEAGLPKDDVVIDANGGVQWAFVYVKEAPKTEAPKDAALLDQAGCRYEPHVVGLVAGQTLKIRNSDATMHNVKTAKIKLNPEFNMTQKDKGMENDKLFGSPEMAIMLECNAHSWMRSWVHVLPHSYFAVTGADGSFTIKGLPAGKYTVEIWHESLEGAKAVEIQVDGTAAKADVAFEYSGKKK